MKKIYTSLLFIVVLVASALVQADVYQQLTSGDLGQIKQATQLMVSGQENTRKNADIVAELLVQKYVKALTTEVDTLAWACKALAATRDGRYRSLLVSIAKSSTHKKLRKYAKSSYKKLPTKTTEPFIKGQINLVSLAETQTIQQSKQQPIVPKASLSSKERIIFAIAKGDLRTIKAVAQDIYQKGKVDRDIADVLSQFLLETYTQSAEFQVDTLAWICRSFGEIEDGRYTQIMEIVSERANHHKIRTYAVDAYKDLPKAENTYVKDSIVLKDIIEKYKA